MFNQSQRTCRLLLGKFLKYPQKIVPPKCIQVFEIPGVFSSTSARLVDRSRPASRTSKRNRYSQRTHSCGDLTSANVGERVELVGWIEFQRMNKFVVLRDAYGTIQLTIPEDRTDLGHLVEGLLYESAMRAIGTVQARPEGQANPRMKSGEVEVIVDSLEVLGPVRKQLPFEIKSFNKAKEQLRMQYRYLDLRFPEMQRNLRLRSHVSMKMREFLINECDFVDVETPTLFRRTPGGAQEFVVPTRLPGKFYSLVQSPQQFKQLLMVGGIDRYFQIARCYRDEGSRSDRQPEFTQLDIEMSFVDRDGIMGLTEDLIVHSWPENLGPIRSPFQRMTFHDAMEFYGSDKPDLRIPYKLENLTEIVKSTNGLLKKFDFDYENDFGVHAIVFPSSNKLFNNSIKTDLQDAAKKEFPEAKLISVKISESSWKNKLNTLFSETLLDAMETELKLRDGDVVFASFGKKSAAQELLGRIRVQFTNYLESKGMIVRETGFKFLWVVDFPLFTRSRLDGGLESTHHPFTQPHSDDLRYLTNDPLKVRGLHYDLVMNGSEIAGGSIRIHNAEMQRNILESLNIDASHMSYLIEALACGAPPHGGIALGLDRYISMLRGTPSIRDVIAFPKTMEGRDLMSGAPVFISEEEKKLYHIETNKCDT